MVVGDLLVLILKNVCLTNRNRKRGGRLTRHSGNGRIGITNEAIIPIEIVAHFGFPNLDAILVMIRQDVRI